jgi:hypothetical protein
MERLLRRRVEDHELVSIKAWMQAPAPAEERWLMDEKET